MDWILSLHEIQKLENNLPIDERLSSLRGSIVGFDFKAVILDTQIPTIPQLVMKSISASLFTPLFCHWGTLYQAEMNMYHYKFCHKSTLNHFDGNGQFLL